MSDILWLLGILFLVWVIIGADRISKMQAQLKELGYDLQKKIVVGKYLCGHPDIDNQQSSTALYLKDGNLHILEETQMTMPKILGEIPSINIKNILVEDQSTVERRVTLGRMLLVGIFAFAWSKRQKNELAYLIFEWSDGRFEHETIFEFEGRDAMVKANTARNGVIKWLR